jgi:hypothetical protein
VSGNGNGPRGDAEYRRLSKLVTELQDLFDVHDRAGLAELTPQQRAEQLQARAAFYGYTNWLWDQAKRRGLRSAYDPEMGILGVYRDLAGGLGDAVVEVSMELRDDDHLSPPAEG